MDSFSDILEPRRQENSNFLWVSRDINTVLAYKQYVKRKPDWHKTEVFSSEKIQEFIRKISLESNKSIVEVEDQVKLILDEIGFKKQLKIIRWLGLVLTKICQKIYSGIHVNENSIERVKNAMGSCPVIFAPSHRSYADFILMSYVCFNYNIEIPAIAAGMDFHGMWGMGNILRNTGAFFMRRSYNDDPLYWETFKQYMHQIVTKGDLPIEFFIEGTRSRSCKSLIPKFGLLSMILKPLFTGEIPDVLIVPINISYDRVLEEKLFAFELLGIPKPKESTSGFFKSLSIIKEHFGNIYVDFTTPISAKQFFGDKLNRSGHSLGPIHHQQLTLNDRHLINDLGYEVLRLQRSHATIMPFNLAAVSLAFLKSNYLSSLASDMSWLRDVLQQFGARVTLESVDEFLNVHGNLIKVNGDRIELVENQIVLDNIDPKKLKGHKLTNETMTKIIPNIMLQLYINPLLHYLTNSCLITIAVLSFGRAGMLAKDELFGHFRLLRTIFSYEFVFYDKMERMEFEETINKLNDLNVIEVSKNEYISFGNNEKLQGLLVNLLSPFISSYFYLCICLQKVPDISAINHASVLTEAQKQMEIALENDDELHSYCLSLDTLSNCLQSYSNISVLEKFREAGQIMYKINRNKLNFISNKLEHISSICAKVGRKSTYYPAHFSAKL